MLRILTLTAFLSAHFLFSTAQDYRIENLSDLLKAARIAPHDAIVLNNIAHCCMQMRDGENAIRYYKLTQKYGTGDINDYAWTLPELKE